MQMLGISTRDGSLTCCTDLNGNVYDIPVFIINDPTNFIVDKTQQISEPTILNEKIRIKLRRAGRELDFDFEILSNYEAKLVKDIYATKEGISSSDVRLFFGGKELKDETTFSKVSISDGMVLQVLVKSA